MNKHTSLSHVRSMIFDLDGTLIDSIPAYFELMKSILEIVGLPPVPRDRVAEFLTDGLPALEKMIPEEMQDRKEALIEECLTVGKKLSREAFKNRVQLFEGVPELFSVLTRRNILIGIATSTHRHFIDRKLQPLVRNRIADALQTVVVIEDVPNRKPAPDPLLECAKRMAVSPEQCAYVGDAHVDIQAGKAAGMTTIGVLTGLDDYQRLKKEKADLILGRAADIRSLF